MASSQPSSSSGPSQEYVVRVPRDAKKRHSILKFHHSLKIDLTKAGPLKMERENNLKDYKLSNDLDMQPKFGAGSEFGREQREEARRKKYGIYLKQYNPDDQPWLMKLGDGKQARKFKGVKEGGISDNVSYFVFTQCPDGAFEAFPVDDWYHFTPQIKHKCLSSEEAEEEFNRRDKTLNYFSIMVKKRLKNEDDADVEEEKEKKVVKKKEKKKGFLLTDLDDWEGMSEEEDDGSDGEGGNTSEKPKKKDKKKKGKSKKFMKTNSDDEALEESDSFDEGQEVDYMTDSDSNDEDMYKEKTGDDETDKYKEQGVEDEDGLKKLMDSDEEEEEEKKEEEEDAEEEEGKETKENKDKKDSDSESSASSDSDSDPEKDVNFSSALFMQKKSEKKRLAEAEKNRSRSATPTEDKVKKRKAEPESSAAKKPKVEPTLSPSSSTASLASEGISEEAVRRYLMRKPMTTKDLVQKFKNTGLSKEQLVNTIAKILKRLDPEKTKLKDKLYLSIKKPE